MIVMHRKSVVGFTSIRRNEDERDEVGMSRAQ